MFFHSVNFVHCKNVGACGKFIVRSNKLYDELMAFNNQKLDFGSQCIIASRGTCEVSIVKANGEADRRDRGSLGCDAGLLRRQSLPENF